MGPGLMLMSTGVSDTGRIWARVEMGPQPSASAVPGDGRAVPFSQLLRSPSETSLLGSGVGMRWHCLGEDLGLLRRMWVLQASSEGYRLALLLLSSP